MSPEQYGKPLYFDVDKFLDVVESLVNSDEVIKAIKMLDELLPSYYKSQLPDRAVEIKNKIYANCWNLHDYCNDQTETYDNSLANQNRLYTNKIWTSLDEIFDSPFAHPRSQVIKTLVQEYNDKGIIPNICELGPANFWLPHGLKAKELKFKYNGNSIQYQSQIDHSGRLKDIWYDTQDEKTDIFVCFEVIEHLWSEQDIMHFYKRKKLNAEFVLISTPLNTLEGGRENAIQKEISHIRTYNENDFSKIASKLFPGREWMLYRSQLMVLKGQQKL